MTGCQGESRLFKKSTLNILPGKKVKYLAPFYPKGAILINIASALNTTTDYLLSRTNTKEALEKDGHTIKKKAEK